MGPLEGRPLLLPARPPALEAVTARIGLELEDSGEEDGHVCTCAFTRFDRHAATDASRYVKNGNKPDPGARITLVCKVRFEDPWQDLGRDADTGIADCDGDIGVLAEIAA